MIIEDGKKINLTFKNYVQIKPVVEKYMKHIKNNHSGLLPFIQGLQTPSAKYNIE